LVGEDLTSEILFRRFTGDVGIEQPAARDGRDRYAAPRHLLVDPLVVDVVLIVDRATQPVEGRFRDVGRIARRVRELVHHRFENRGAQHLRRRARS
jgi:hypothetical protein